jgi:hypothetical protein
MTVDERLLVVAVDAEVWLSGLASVVHRTVNVARRTSAIAR